MPIYAKVLFRYGQQGKNYVKLGAVTLRFWNIWSTFVIVRKFPFYLFTTNRNLHGISLTVTSL